MTALYDNNVRLANKRRQTTRRKGILAVLGCVVVVATALALMVPAISMTRGELTCGIEEHTHGDACYEQVLVCGQEESEGHVHSDACYEQVLACGQEEGEDHAHTDACYEKQLVCGQEESQGHSHSDACYESQLTCDKPEHVHTDACYSHEQAAASNGAASSAASSSSEAVGASSSAAAASSAAASAGSSAASDAAKMPAAEFEKKLERVGAPDVKVKVKAPEGALPEGATMEAKLVLADDVKAKVEEAIERESGKDEEIVNITAVDIAFKDKSGNEIEPAKAVEVKITSEDVNKFKDPVLVHVLDKSKESSKGNPYDAEVVAKVKIVNEDDENLTVGTEDTMKFESKAFSPYVIVELAAELEKSATTITATASDGATVEITGELPEGAQASITPVKLTEEELVEYYGEDLIEAIDNMVVYDICILVNGVEWEPDETVSVVIKSPAIETKKSNEEISVTHLEDEAKTVEDVKTKVTKEGDVTFKTDSFSLWGLYTFTVDYYLNDNEYHQPGNTSMMLSELFEHLLVNIPVSEVANVEFTDYTLLQFDREGDDIRITSLQPFSTSELLTINFKDGSVLTIVVEDYKYANYTYEESDLTPYVGSFNYVGHYNIFGGGNGIPSVINELPDNWWAGNWGGNSYWDSDAHPSDGGVQVTLPALKGKAIGNDQNGDPLVAESGKFKSGSSADIQWSGDEVVQAFMSFSWLYYFSGDGSKPTHAIFDIKLYAPGGDYTPIVLNTDGESPDPRGEDTGQAGKDTTSAWRMLSFDATNFVKEHGPGTYTMIVTVEPTPGHTTINSYLSDMGFTIFGVTSDSSQPVSAVAGVVDEIMISQDSSSLPNRTAEVSFSEPVTPRGNGKAWFNCQGGEYITEGTDGVEHDRDYLEAKTVSGKYLKFGGGETGDIPITGWDAEDIASPNHNQTAPNGLEKYSNRCSFGLGTFSGLRGIEEIVGLRKKMVQGNDCFGSMMLLLEVMPVNGSVQVTKKLEFDGNGVTPVLPESGVERTLKFDVTPVDGAPAPDETHYEITFPAGSGDGKEVLFEMGAFTFSPEDLAGDGPTWEFVYEVNEDTTTNGDPWTYDTRTLQLHFQVSINEADGEVRIDRHWWTVKNETIDLDKFFKNGYVLPTELAVNKVDVDGNPVKDATFMLYEDPNCTQIANVFTDKARTAALTEAGVKTDDDGLAHFYGMKKDNAPYYLKETAVVSPYILDGKVVTVSYDEDNDKWVYQEEGASEPTPMDATVSDTEDLGTISLQRVNNRYQHLEVNKAWAQNDFVTAHGKVSVALFHNVEGTPTLIDGTERELSAPDWSTTYDISDGDYSLDDVFVREVVVSGSTVTEVEGGGVIAVFGETTKVATSGGATDIYVVTYSQGETTQKTEGNTTVACRKDTVTNTMPKLAVNKNDEGDSRLAGAKFIITDDQGNQIDWYGNYTSTDSGDGNLIGGIYLSQGTYYLVETEAPDGYNKLTYKVKLTVSDQGETQVITAATEPASVTSIDVVVSDDKLLYTATIHNSSGVELPMTGGPGTTVYVLGGLALIVAAACIYGFGSRRGRERKM